MTSAKTAPAQKIAAQPSNRSELVARLIGLLAQCRLILDGAMVTVMQQHKLTEADCRGARFADIAQVTKGNNNLLALTKPEFIA